MYTCPKYRPLHLVRAFLTSWTYLVRLTKDRQRGVKKPSWEFKIAPSLGSTSIIRRQVIPLALELKSFLEVLADILDQNFVSGLRWFKIVEAISPPVGSWSLPPVDQWNLNINAYALGTPGKVGIRGLMWDSEEIIWQNFSGSEDFRSINNSKSCHAD